MIPNFVFTDEVKKIAQTAKITDLTTHYSTWKQHGEDNKINGKKLYDIECPDIYAGEIDDGVMTDIFLIHQTERTNNTYYLLTEILHLRQLSLFSKVHTRMNMKIIVL